MRKQTVFSALMTLSYLFILLLPGLTASAYEISAGPQQEGPTDPAELEAFLDGFFAEQMEALHISGAVVVFVKNGEVFLAKGYGVADVESQNPVDPAQTIFRPGSISKLFIATAIMQLAEQERLNLDDPVNKHLQDFQLEDTYPAPVTIANLLTHTGGFDVRLTGIGTSDPAKLLPLGEYLAARMPPRVLPPGDQIYYSNHGFALAGYVVEQISNLTFAQYVEEYIFKPLGMNRSSFEEPMPAHLAPDMAIAYVYRNQTHHPVPPDHLHISPAGSLYTTAMDMAPFMIAQLQDGRYGEHRILAENTTQEMHRQQFTHHPQLPGFAYGFFELYENGQRALAHLGNTTAFSSLLFLLPDQNEGFFVSLNSSVGPHVGGFPRRELITRFLDHHYPVPVPEASSGTTTVVNDLQRFEGSYGWHCYARTTLEKLLPPVALLQFRVTANADGTLTETPPWGMGEPTHWTSVGPLLFQAVAGDGIMAFREDEEGRITHLFTSFLGMPVAREKVAWYETGRFQASLMASFTLLFLSTLIWPLANLIRRWRKRPAHFSRRERQARALSASVVVLNLIFLVGLVVRMSQLGACVFYDTPAFFIALLAIPILTALLAVPLIVFTVRAWKEGYWATFGRVHYSLITLATLAFTYFVYYWNMLGFRL